MNAGKAYRKGKTVSTTANNSVLKKGLPGSSFFDFCQAFTD
jgi:hypothetical protein